VASIDLKKVYRDLYSARAGKPALVEVPPLAYLMIDGAGDPNTSSEYVEAVGAIYPIAYAVRAAIKKATGDAYTVMPMQGLWWADDMDRFSPDRKGDWKWTMMIAVPDLATRVLADTAIAETTAKKGLAAGNRVRFELFDEGRSAQVMHIGPYSAEAPTIAMLHAYIIDQGMSLRGLHHEIYLGDPRKTAPDKLKTIIRQPVV
jgi:hypothetical protein